MRFLRGELLVPKDHVFGTTVWDASFNDVVDSLEANEIVTVTKAEDSYGWTWVLTPRGKVGVVHRANLRREPQVVENIKE